jgi:hypothetical protein
LFVALPDEVQPILDTHLQGLFLRLVMGVKTVSQRIPHVVVGVANDLFDLQWFLLIVDS